MAVQAAPGGGTRLARGERYTSDFRDLTARVRDAGLMGRCYGFYLGSLAVAAVALAGVGVGVVLLGDSWLQLLLAAALGVVLAQLGFLAHEACHRQIFRSARANEWAGRVLSGLLVGISYGWWMTKHTRHHANPNRIGRDPDIDSSAVAFTEEAAAGRRGPGAWLVRRQGYFFLPLLTLEGLSLYVSSYRQVLGRRPVKRRRVEIAFLTLRHAAYLTAVFALLPPGLASTLR